MFEGQRLRWGPACTRAAQRSTGAKARTVERKADLQRVEAFLGAVGLEHLRTTAVHIIDSSAGA